MEIVTPDFVFACGVELGVVRPHGDGRAKHKARLRGALLGVVRVVESRMCALRSVRSGLFPHFPSARFVFGVLGERMKLIAEGRYLERLNEYVRVGTQLGYRPLASATDEFEDWLIETSRMSGRPLTIAVTHDINVASFLAGRGVVSSFTNETWPHSLDAAVIMLDGHGYAEYGFLKHVDCGEE